MSRLNQPQDWSRAGSGAPGARARSVGVPSADEKVASTWSCRWSPPEIRPTKHHPGIGGGAKANFCARRDFGPDYIEELRATSFSPDFDMLYQQDCDFQALPAITRRSLSHLYRADAGGRAGCAERGSRRERIGKEARTASFRRGACRATGTICSIEFREQCDFTDLRDNLRRFRKIYRPVAILIERAANGHALISDLSRKYSNLVCRSIPMAGPSPRAFASMLTRSWPSASGLPATGLLAGRLHCRVRRISARRAFTDQVDATTQLLDHAGEFAGLEPSPPGRPSSMGEQRRSDTNDLVFQWARAWPRCGGSMAMAGRITSPRSWCTRFIIEAGVKY